MTEAFICDAIRTPIGRYGGALSTIRADDLAAIPIRALVERNPGVDWGALDDIILGCANQAGEDNRNLARMAATVAIRMQQVFQLQGRLAEDGRLVGHALRRLVAGDLVVAARQRGIAGKGGLLNRARTSPSAEPSDCAAQGDRVPALACCADRKWLGLAPTLDVVAQLGYDMPSELAASPERHRPRHGLSRR